MKKCYHIVISCPFTEEVWEKDVEGYNSSDAIRNMFIFICSASGHSILDLNLIECNCLKTI